jgi:hypothetical protein
MTAYGDLPVDLLQAPDPDRVAAAEGQGFGDRFGRAHRGDARQAVGDGSAPDGVLVAERVRAGRPGLLEGGGEVAALSSGAFLSDKC